MEYTKEQFTQKMLQINSEMNDFIKQSNGGESKITIEKYNELKEMFFMFKIIVLNDKIEELTTKPLLSKI